MIFIKNTIKIFLLAIVFSITLFPSFCFASGAGNGFQKPSGSTNVTASDHTAETTDGLGGQYGDNNTGDPAKTSVAHYELNEETGKLEIHITKDWNGNQLVGMQNTLENSGEQSIINYPANEHGVSMNQYLLDYGCTQAQIDAFIAANNIYVNPDNGYFYYGDRRDENGRMPIFNEFDLQEIMGLKGQTTTPPSNLAGVTSVPPGQIGEWKLESSTRDTFLSGSGSGQVTNLIYEKNGKIFQGKKTYEGYSYSVSMPSGSASYLYSVAGRTPAKINVSKPNAVGVHVTYSGKWVTTMKYQYKRWIEEYSYSNPCTCSLKNNQTCQVDHGITTVPAHWEYDAPPRYIIIGYPTASASVNGDSTIYYPEYTEKLPLDLKTEGAYNGTININDKHGYTFNNAPKSNALVDVKITDKSGRKPGEMFTLLANNNPVGFTLDFGNTWMGIPTSMNLDGPSQGWVSNGYQFVPWAKLYWGPDKDAKDRDPKVSSVTYYMGNTESSEILDSEETLITNGQTGKVSFFLRNIMENKDGQYYELGESGNNCWWTAFEIQRCNLRGWDWSAQFNGSPSISAGVTRSNYTKYIIFDYFKQPILYGQYDSQSAAGR